MWYSSKPHSPLQFCISDEHSGVSAVFAVLPDWHPGEDFSVTVLELIEKVDVCVRVASILQVSQACPTRLGRAGIDDLIETQSYICGRLNK